MSATVRLIYNAIIAGKWYSAGDPIPKEILPDKLRQFIEKPAPKSPPPDEPEERNLMLHYNQRYSVDEDGFLRPAVARQAAELQVRAQDEEALADELAEAEISPQVAAAIAQGQEDYAADVAVQAANARVQAEHADAAQEFVREEQDEKVAAGEYDQFDTPPPPPPPPKVNPKSGNYILRGRKFVPVTGAKLVPGEKLYWYRPRQGQLPGKFISFGTVKSTKPKNPTHV